MNYIDDFGLKQGYWEEKGSIYSYEITGNYLNNKKEGRWIEYYISIKGERIYKGYFIFINNVLQTHVRYYSNGNIKTKTNRLNSENKSYESWYPDGEKRYLYFTKNGKDHGEYKFWYKNGNIKYYRQYKNGLICSNCYEYDEENKLIYESIYLGNTKHFIKGYNSGRRGFIVNKERDGFWILGKQELYYL